MVLQNLVGVLPYGKFTVKRLETKKFSGFAVVKGNKIIFTTKRFETAEKKAIGLHNRSRKNKNWRR